MTRLSLIAVAGYLTGLGIGLGVCWAAWATTTHEHTHRLNWRNA